MPEKEISDQEREAVRDWISNTKRGGNSVLVEGSQDHWVHITMVNGEPFVLINHDEGVSKGKHELYISERHAQQLEEAGILTFSEAPEATK